MDLENFNIDVGQSVSLKVKIDPNSLPRGHIEYYLTIESNDPSKSSFEIQVYGNNLST